jgi:sulfate permease, SulP family
LDALGAEIQVVADIAEVPRALPLPQLPVIGDIPALILPAVSLAFVGLVQGAGVSAGFPNADGSVGDTSRDFVGQGAGNVASGLFQGMPVGGSMSATSLTVAAGATTRGALLVAGVVMALVVLALGEVVERIAMPSLAALLIVVGIGTIKPATVVSVAKTGTVQLTVMTTTLVLTMLIPLQYAVVVGVAISVTLFVGRQSSRLTTKRLVFGDERAWREVDPPDAVGAHEVVVLQPYGSVFFAAAPMLEEQMPDVGPSSRNSVVILRLRGIDDAGATLMDVLRRYAASLTAVGSKLVLVTDNPRVIRQLEVSGTLATIGVDNVYLGSEWVGRTVREAHRDALRWIESRRGAGPSPEGS